MKRTLLAIGIAVLISMLCVPVTLGPLPTTYFMPFFAASCCDEMERAKFVLQTTFLAVLAAVIVNLFRRKPKT